ncbi:MAG: MarR family winged helix-turn-helix transcriptional regulator [bacterium]
MRLLSSVSAFGQEFSFSQTMVLMTLLNARQTSMNQLAEMLGVSKANASGLVDRLAKKRLVIRHRSSEDRRVVLVQLTSSGIKAARQLVKLNRRGLVQMMRRIPDHNLKVFIDTLEQLAYGLLTNQ